MILNILRRRCHLLNSSLYIDAFEGSFKALKEREYIHTRTNLLNRLDRNSVLSVLSNFMKTIVFREK